MSEHASSVVTEEQAAAKWHEIAPLIDGLMRRTDNRDDFQVLAGSSLAGDDRATDPYQTSHVMRWCITAAADHLHAVKTLVVDAHVLHVAAPASLARVALENAATAVWVLGPTSREERVIRTLRWYARNFRDADTAVSGLNQPDYQPLKERLDRVGAVAA